MAGDFRYLYFSDKNMISGLHLARDSEDKLIDEEPSV
jgi:hypothetical protein